MEDNQYSNFYNPIPFMNFEQPSQENIENANFKGEKENCAMDDSNIEDEVFFDTGAYNENQIKDALSPENKWYAGEQLGHSPNDDEAMDYWLSHGGPEHFAQKHRKEFFKNKNNI